MGQQVWQWCSTTSALIWFLAPVVAALIASVLLPQAPIGLHADEFRYQEWLSARQVEFKNWTPLLTAIGAFQIRETLWFRVLLSLLAFVLLVSLGEQIRLLLAPVIVQKPSLFYDSSEAVSITSDLPYEQTVHRIRQFLGRHTLHVQEPNTTYLYAGRRAWARAGTAIIYLGLLVLVCGIAIQARWGWRQPEIRVLPYQHLTPVPGGALQLRLLDVQPGFQNSETESALVAHLQIADETVLPIRLGVPARHRGYRYLWVSKGGPSVQLSAYRVSDPQRPLDLYDYAVRSAKAPSLQFSFATGQDTDRPFILSEAQVVGWLRWQDEEKSAGSASPKFQLWLFGEDGQQLGIETFVEIDAEPGTSTQQAIIGDVDYHLQVARYIVLDIAYQPGLWMLWLGGALLVLGTIGAPVPQAKVWARISAQDERTEIRWRDQREHFFTLRGKRQEHRLAQLQDVLETAHSRERSVTQQQVQKLPSEQDFNAHRTKP